MDQENIHTNDGAILIRINWFTNSLFLALLPIVLKAFLITILVEEEKPNLVDYSDLCFYCVTLGVGNLNDLLSKFKNEIWKSVFTGISVFFIIVSSLFYALLVIHQNSKKTKFNTEILHPLAIFLIFCSISVSIFLLVKVTKK